MSINRKMTPAEQALYFSDVRVPEMHNGEIFLDNSDDIESALGHIDTTSDFVLYFGAKGPIQLYSSEIYCSYYSPKLGHSIIICHDMRMSFTDKNEFVKYLDELNQKAIVLEASISKANPE